MILTLAASASAFSTQTKQKSTIGLRMSELQGDEEKVATAVDNLPSPSETVAATPKMSQSLPFMERPAALDGSLVGDVGFDPLGFAKTKVDLLNYREAEIKHSRLAMLVRYSTSLS